MSDLDILNELLQSSPVVRRAMKCYLHKAYRRGEKRGERAAREAFDELLARVHQVSHLNGTTEVFKAAWQESQHPRNHGQFSSQPGASGGSKPAATNRIEHPADTHTRSLASRIGEVPKRIRVKVAHLVRKRYDGLVEKFGRNGARAIIGASIMMLPVPLPFASAIPIALAHAVLKLRNLVGSGTPVLAKAMGAEPSRDQLDRAAREFIEDIYRDMGEEPPEMPEELDLNTTDPDDDSDADDADTPVVVPADDEDEVKHPDGDAIALALLEHAIPAMELGEDPEPGLRAILGAMDGSETIHKAFDESKHPRDDGGRFVSKEAIHEAKSDPTKAAELRARVTNPEQRKKLDAALEGKTDLGRTKQGERKQLAAQKRYVSEADKKRADELIRHFADNYSTGELTRADLKRLVEHLPRMRLVDLKRAREALRANLHGDRQKADVVARLVAHAKDQIADLTPDRKKKHNRLNTVIAEVMAHGGIDPASLKDHVGDVSALEDSIPLSVVKRGGMGLDELAQELASAGHISIPENAHPGEYLLDQIRSRAHTLAADLGKQEEDKLNDYYKALHEAELHHEQPALDEAIRSGEGAGRDQASEDLLGETGGEPDAQEPEGAVDDSFDFGANAGGESTSESAGEIGDYLDPSHYSTKQAYEDAEFARLKKILPDDDEEVLRAQAQDWAGSRWTPPPEKGKYSVGQTVKVGDMTGSYRGTFTGEDGKKYAVVAGGHAGQMSVPIEQVEHASEAKPEPLVMPSAAQETKPAEGAPTRQSWTEKPISPMTSSSSGGYADGSKTQFDSQGNAIEGHLGDIPISTESRGLMQKVSKKTRAEMEKIANDPETRQALTDAGIHSILVRDNTNRNLPSGWTMAHSAGTLVINPQTAERVAKRDKVRGFDRGMAAVVHHEAGHGLWSRANDGQRQSFRQALAAHPEVKDEIAKRQNIKPPMSRFDDKPSSDYETEEVHAELNAIRKYDPEKFAKLPADVRAAVESIASNHATPLPEHLRFRPTLH